MKTAGMRWVGLLVLLGTMGRAAESAGDAANEPAPLDMKKAEAEVAAHYARAHPEVKEYCGASRSSRRSLS